MQYDCGFQKEKNVFRYRTGGIIINNGKMLFVKSSIGDYFYMVGGAVRLGETSVSCIEREVLEETGIKARVNRLSVICENFFKGKGGKIDGLDCHTIELYFNMTIDNLDLLKTQSDMGEDIVWLPINEVKFHTIKPTVISEKIEDILTSNYTLHIIEERDR